MQSEFHLVSYHESHVIIDYCPAASVRASSCGRLDGGGRGDDFHSISLFFTNLTPYRPCDTHETGFGAFQHISAIASSKESSYRIGRYVMVRDHSLP